MCETLWSSIVGMGGIVIGDSQWTSGNRAVSCPHACLQLSWDFNLVLLWFNNSQIHCNQFIQCLFYASGLNWLNKHSRSSHRKTESLIVLFLNYFFFKVFLTQLAFSVLMKTELSCKATELRRTFLGPLKGSLQNYFSWALGRTAFWKNPPVSTLFCWWILNLLSWCQHLFLVFFMVFLLTPFLYVLTTIVWLAFDWCSPGITPEHSWGGIPLCPSVWPECHGVQMDCAGTRR